MTGEINVETHIDVDMRERKWVSQNRADKGHTETQMTGEKMKLAVKPLVLYNKTRAAVLSPPSQPNPVTGGIGAKAYRPRLHVA